MKEYNKASDVGTSEANEKGAELSSNSLRYYITVIMGITTIIAGLNISGLWSGVVTALCAIATLMMIYDEVGGFDD